MTVLAMEDATEGNAFAEITFMAKHVRYFVWDL